MEQKYCSCSPFFFAPWNVVLIVLMINGATGLPRFHLQANQLPFYELSVSTQNVEWLLSALGGDTQRSSPTKYWCKKCFLGRGSGKAASGAGGEGVCRGNDTGKHHCRHLFHGSPDKVFNPEIWVRVWTSLSHLHFTHFSYFGGAKKNSAGCFLFLSEI